MNYQITLGYPRLGSPITWEGVPNFHAYLSGSSGQGKTFLLRSMASQVPALGGRCIIFDYSGDFLSPIPQQSWPPPDTKIVNIRSDKVNINPFLPQNEEETTDEIAERVVGILSSGTRLGEVQWAYLFDTILTGMESDSFENIPDLVEQIEEDAEDKNQVAQRLLYKMRRLSKLLPRCDCEFDWKLETPGITIVDLTSIQDPSTLAILAELLLWTICNLRMRGGPRDASPLVLLLDECQRLRFRSGDTTVRILREGRKFGIWGWFSTQWMHNKEAAAALGQAALRVYFRPEDENLHKVAIAFSHGVKDKVSLYEKQLASLKRGQFMLWKGTRLLLSRPPA